jgi:hypothetical protein
VIDEIRRLPPASQAAALATLVLVLSACGSSDSGSGSAASTTTSEQTTEVDQTPTKEKPEPSGIEIVGTCADLTGQDPFGKPPAKPSFIACLKRLDVPQDVLDAWTGG